METTKAHELSIPYSLSLYELCASFIRFIDSPAIIDAQHCVIKKFQVSPASLLRASVESAS